MGDADANASWWERFVGARHPTRSATVPCAEVARRCGSASPLAEAPGPAPVGLQMGHPPEQDAANASGAVTHDVDATPPALSSVANASPQRFDQTTPNVGRVLGARVVNDVADGYKEVVNDLPLDKLRDDVHNIGRVVGVGT